MARGILFGRTDRVSVQFFRYTFVGGVAFLADFGTLFALTDFFGLHYLVSAAVAFAVGLTVNYLLSIAWVFSARSLSSRTTEFAIFTFIGIIGLGLNEFFMWFFTEVAGFYYLVSKMVSALFVYLWNFGARKMVLFRQVSG